MKQEFCGKWENKGVVFEMFRRWGNDIKDHLEMETYPAGKENERVIFTKTTHYIEPMDFLLYCEYNYNY